MGKILTFGEILLRMSPALNGKWIKDSTIPTYVGGAELNVANALANWNIPVSYFSVMPDNALGQEIYQYLNSKNICTDTFLMQGKRIGIYYLPQGADLKNAGVIYDREYSSFSELKSGQIEWDSVFKDVEWFQFSAITPAINQNLADVCLEGLKIAKSKGIKIAVDLNYRSKLWKYGKEGIEIMPELVSYCDLIMGNIWAANKLLGISIDPKVEINQADKNRYLEHAKSSSIEILEKFPACKYVANTFRFDYETTGIEYYTSLYADDELYVSPHFFRKEIVDRVGSGDCFMGGLLYGFYNNNSSQQIIDFASAAAIGKLNEFGDASQQSIDDVLKVLRNVEELEKV